MQRAILLTSQLPVFGTISIYARFLPFRCPWSNSQAGFSRSWKGNSNFRQFGVPTGYPLGDGEMKLIAEGFEWVETQQQDGFFSPSGYPERRLLVRSVTYRHSASRCLDNHLSKACHEIRKLGDHGKGKRPPRDPEAFQSAIDKILSAHRVEGLIDVRLEVKAIERKVRGYKGQPDRNETIYDITRKQVPGLLSYQCRGRRKGGRTARLSCFCHQCFGGEDVSRGCGSHLPRGVPYRDQFRSFEGSASVDLTDVSSA